MFERLKSLCKLITKENIYFMFLFFFSISIPFSNHIANDFMTLALLVWIFIKRKRFEKDWLTLFMGLLTISFILSSLVNWNHIPTPFVKKHSMVFQEILSLVTPFLWFLIVRSTPVSFKKISIIVSTFAAATFIATVNQILFPNPESINFENHLMFYYNPNFTGGLLAFGCSAMVILFLASKKTLLRLILIPIFLVSAVGLFLTSSRGAWLAFIAGLIFLLMYYFKKSSKLLLATSVIILIASFIIGFTLSKVIPHQQLHSYIVHDTNDVSSGRWGIWKIALEMTQHSPWFGIGPKMFKSYYARMVPSNAEEIHIHAHNNFLQVLAETGLVGLVLFIVFDVLLFVHVFRFIKRFEEGSLAYYLSFLLIIWLIIWNVHGLFDYTFGLKYLTLPMLFLFGILLSNNNQPELSESDFNSRHR